LIGGSSNGMALGQPDLVPMVSLFQYRESVAERLDLFDPIKHKKKMHLHCFG
jgi:hypothetical protein